MEGGRGGEGANECHLKTALNGLPRASEGVECWWGEKGGTMANTPDGPKWTAWSVTGWRARNSGVSEWVEENALRTALNGRPRH